MAWQRFKSNRAAVISAWFLAVLLALIVAWPVTLKIVAGGTLLPKCTIPTSFPTRNLRRRPRSIGSARTFMAAMFFPASCTARKSRCSSASSARCVSLVIGVLWGAIAGYVGGRVDSALMRIVDVLYSLPTIIFVIVLLTTLGALLKQSHFVQQSAFWGREMQILLLFVGLGAVSWLTMARIVRGQVLSLRTRAFVEASRSLGAGPARILARHIIPNIFGVVITYIALTMPAIVLYESFLSYLGLGVQPPMASWGTLIAEGVSQINPIRIYWWLIAFPGGVLVTTLLALNFLGDGLRDAWDIKSR